MGAAVSIDQSIFGLLRHRFVRAVSASALVLVAIGLMATIIYGLFNASIANRTEFIELSLGLAVVGPAIVFALALGVSIVGALLDAVHRRISAFVLLIVNAFVFAMGVLIACIGALMEVGWLPRTEADTYASWQNWSIVALLVVAAMIAFEGVGWAWWQMRVSRAEFFAARGWRSPPWRVLSSLRQRLGLPAYISNFGRGRVSLTIIYFFVAVLNMGLVALLVIPFFIFAIEQGAAGVSTPLLVALGLASLVVLNAIGFGALLQNIAAARATKLYQNARDWDGRPPILFLRAFDQDNAKLKAASRDPLVKFPAGCGEARTLDEILLEHASVYGPVVAVGDPRDPTPPLGAARVFVQGDGNEWQNVVTSLVRASNAVIMCPSTSEGVQWELDLIADALGRVRVIFIANPELTPEQTRALFQRIAPNARILPHPQTPIAAWLDESGEWFVLTTSKPPCVQSYTVALNYALQTTLGMKGVKLERVKRKKAA